MLHLIGYLLLSVSSLTFTPTQELSTVKVIMVVEDRNGNLTGVGEGEEIFVLNDDLYTVSVGKTNALSEYNFSLPYATYAFVAILSTPIPRGSWWNCYQKKVVNEPEEYVLITCKQRWWISFPWTRK